jgi:hypothetical protein
MQERHRYAMVDPMLDSRFQWELRVVCNGDQVQGGDKINVLRLLIRSASAADLRMYELMSIPGAWLLYISWHFARASAPCNYYLIITKCAHAKWGMYTRFLRFWPGVSLYRMPCNC